MNLESFMPEDEIEQYKDAIKTERLEAELDLLARQLLERAGESPIGVNVKVCIDLLTAKLCVKGPATDEQLDVCEEKLRAIIKVARWLRRAQSHCKKHGIAWSKATKLVSPEGVE
jgi:hypothetical protein